MPSPYNGAVGSISAACVSRLSEETINWASLSSSAVSALFDRVSFITSSFIFLCFLPSSDRYYSSRTREAGRAGFRSSGARKPAVDHDHLAGNEAFRLDERHHGFGHVLRGDTALQRGELGAASHEVFVFVLKHPVHPITFHPARRDGVHADFRTEIISERLGQADYRCLARSEERRVGKECRSRWSPYH